MRKKCRICHVVTELDETGRCRFCAVCAAAVESGTSYGKYVVRHGTGWPQVMPKQAAAALPTDRTCPVCGKAFLGSGSHRRYCSTECRGVAAKEAERRYRKNLKARAARGQADG